MTDVIETEIIDTSPIDDGLSAVSTEGLAAELSAELAAEDAAKAEAKAEAKPEKASDSIDEALKKAMAKASGKAEAEAEPEKAEKKEEKPKAQRSADGKFVAPEKEADKAGGQEAADNLQSEGKKINAPARLLPSERDVWVNTPRAVQGAFERIEREYEAKLVEREESAKFHTELKEFDELAKKSGTTVKQALANYVNAENAIRQDFGRGVAQLAQSMGKNPTEAVAQLMRASGVTAQQLGAYLQGQPTQAPQQQAQQRQADPVAQQALKRIQQLESQLEAQRVEAERAANEQRIQREIIEPAMAEMPRFDELSPHIAKYLQSDIIDRSLSPDLRLREAYFMADRLFAAPLKASEEVADPDVDSKVTALPRKKQISGSPSASTTRIAPKGPAPSIDDALEAAFRRATKR